MLAEEAQPALVQRDQHRHARLACRRAADVRDARLGHLPDRPAGPPDAVAPVHLLRIHKELLVHPADLLDHRSARQNTGAERVVDREGRAAALLRVAAVPPGAVEPARQRLAGREEVEQGHHKRREAERRRLDRAVGVQQPRTGRSDARVRLGEGDQLLDRAGVDDRIGIEEQNIVGRWVMRDA